MGNGNGVTAMARVEQPGGALATSEVRYEGLAMAFAPAEALRRIQELQAFIGQVMEKDLDYGVIPGTDKPTLFKPGAEKLAELYGFSWHFDDDGSVQDWEKGFFNFRKRCTLTSRRDGRYIGDGVGSCNSRESKYSGRWLPESEIPGWHDKTKLRCKPGIDWKFENQLPPGVDKKSLQTKQITGKKNGNKYQMYGVPADLYQVPNDEVFSLVNTMEKMAWKRAFVGAIVAATRSSGIFSQDLEDLPEEVYGQAAPERSWERRADVGPGPSTGLPQQAAKGKANPELEKMRAEIAALPNIDAIAAWDVENKARTGELSDADYQVINSAMNARADEIERAIVAAAAAPKGDKVKL